MISNKLVYPLNTQKTFFHEWVGLRKDAQSTLLCRA
jgi:hypothetical protein